MSIPPPRPTVRTTEDSERNRIGRLIDEGSRRIFEAIPLGDAFTADAIDDLIHALTAERRKLQTRNRASTHKPPSLHPRPYTMESDLGSAAPSSTEGADIRFPLPGNIPLDLTLTRLAPFADHATNSPDSTGLPEGTTPSDPPPKS